MGWDCRCFVRRRVAEISIHPSRVGWDLRLLHLITRKSHFNPPIPCGMGPARWRRGQRERHFNPPIPCGMGHEIHSAKIDSLMISIHPSRVGWDISPIAAGARRCISIHPSRVGWDYEAWFEDKDAEIFQSTHPVWDGTVDPTKAFLIIYISIHPSRVGWDHPSGRRTWRDCDFNPPIPCGMGLLRSARSDN